MKSKNEPDGAAVEYSRTDTVEVINTLILVLGSQDAAAAAIHASQPQVSAWCKGDTTMTPGYMALARRLMFEADRRQLFIREFYRDRLLANGYWNPDGFMTVQEDATVSNIDTNGRAVTQRTASTAPVDMVEVSNMTIDITRSYFTWSFHAAGDYFGFYMPARDTAGINTVVFYVDREDNTIGRGDTDPVFRIQNPNKAVK